MPSSRLRISAKRLGPKAKFQRMDTFHLPRRTLTVDWTGQLGLVGMWGLGNGEDFSRARRLISESQREGNAETWRAQRLGRARLQSCRKRRDSNPALAAEVRISTSSRTLPCNASAAYKFVRTSQGWVCALG